MVDPALESAEHSNERVGGTDKKILKGGIRSSAAAIVTDNSDSLYDHSYSVHQP